MNDLPPSRLGPLVVDPDTFLQTEAGRVWTPERNRDAWQRAFAALDQMLVADKQIRVVVIVCGLQGAGKSTWIRSRPRQADTVYFDAALPGARHRRPIIDIARSAGAALEAVWIRTSLVTAIRRNALRAADAQVPEATIRAVHSQFEPPTPSEGFARIQIVDA